MARKTYENPLLSHNRLREIYAALIDARARKPRAGRTDDAAIISAAIGLRDSPDVGDVVSAGAHGDVVELALGLLPRAIERGKRSPQRIDSAASGPSLSTTERAFFTLGVAARLPKGAIAMLFLSAGDLPSAGHKRFLAEVACIKPPLIILALAGRGAEPGIAEIATKHQVPGIPVAADDPVALYRAAQECLGRARAGGGAALIEAVRFTGSPDPRALLRRQIVARGAATERWCAERESRAAKA